MLRALEGQYDAIYSLGCNCLPSIQLDKNGLRKSAGVLDWMQSDYLPCISVLLRYRFAGFMDERNLEMAGMDMGETNYLVEDTAYKIIAGHHFPVERNRPGYWGSYPEFKLTMNRRIWRFLEKAAYGQKMLLVRTGGARSEAAELEEVLSGLVANDFRVLIVNYTNTPVMREVNWGLKRVVSMELPPYDIWHGQDDLWRCMLEGVTLRTDDSQDETS